MATLGPAKSSQLEIRKKDDRTPASPKGPQSVRASERGVKTVVRSGVVGRVAKKSVKATKSSVAKQTTHVVRRGENLATIARKYQVSVRELASHNRLKNQSVLFVGKRLEIPGL